jgi:AbiTii-like protein
MSLLGDIQNDLASAEGDVTTVLRKCKILAARLGSEEFAQWVEWELDGYPDSQPMPVYRRLGIIYYASFLNMCWRLPKQPVPIQFVPEKNRESFRHAEFRDGIAKVVSFTRSNGATIQRPELIFALQGKMYPDMECQGVWGEIAVIEFEQLISAVKNRILGFVLKIEAENPAAGEAIPNTQPVAREKLQPLVHNTFYGPVGNVAQNGERVNQTANIGFQSTDLQRLVADFSGHLHELNLGAREKGRAEAQIAALKAELSGEPDFRIVSQAGRTLRNVTEGAIASLLATAAQPTVWQWIHQTLQAL